MAAQDNNLTRSQRLLLTAALSGHESALLAWVEWCRDFPLDDAGQEEFWILPLIFRHLEGGGFEGPERGRLKGIYKQTRLRSAILRPKLEALLEKIAQRGIQAEAAPLTHQLLVNADSALPLEPAELVCTADSADLCDALVTEAGWKPERGIPHPRMRAFIGAVTYRQKALGTLRLVWDGTVNRLVIPSVMAWHLGHPGEDWRTAPVTQATPPPANRMQRLRWHWRRYHGVERHRRPALFPAYLHAWHRYFQ